VHTAALLAGRALLQLFHHPVDAETASHLAMIPAIFGRGRILGELGRGAMGTVYRAHDPLIEPEVAIPIVARQISFAHDLGRKVSTAI
jgi:hypothetical protein